MFKGKLWKFKWELDEELEELEIPRWQITKLTSLSIKIHQFSNNEIYYAVIKRTVIDKENINKNITLLAPLIGVCDEYKNSIVTVAIIALSKAFVLTTF